MATTASNTAASFWFFLCGGISGTGRINQTRVPSLLMKYRSSRSPRHLSSCQTTSRSFTVSRRHLPGSRRIIRTPYMPLADTRVLPTFAASACAPLAPSKLASASVWSTRRTALRRGHLLGVLHHLFDGPRHVERGLGDVVVLAVGDLLEA